MCAEIIGWPTTMVLGLIAETKVEWPKLCITEGRQLC